MGKLKDLLAKKQSTIADTETHGVIQEERKPASPVKYDRDWLRKMSNKTGFIVSDDDKKVDGILLALNRKDGHCPCGGNGRQFICPCVIMRENGICKCGLYKNVEHVAPKGKSSGKIKENTNE